MSDRIAELKRELDALWEAADRHAHPRESERRHLLATDRLRRALHESWPEVSAALATIRKKPDRGEARLSDRLRPNSEAAPWIVDAVLALEADLAASELCVERLRRERLDYSSVTTTEGMNASEWVWRTGKAERVAKERAATIGRLRREVLAWRRWSDLTCLAASTNPVAKAIVAAARECSLNNDLAADSASHPQ